MPFDHSVCAALIQFRSPSTFLALDLGGTNLCATTPLSHCIHHSNYAPRFSPQTRMRGGLEWR